MKSKRIIEGAITITLYTIAVSLITIILYGCNNHVQAFNFRSVQEADGADTSGKGLGTDTDVDTEVATAVETNK